MILTVAVFAVLEFASICLLKSSSSMQAVWINRLSGGVLRIMWSGSESIRQNFSLREANLQLSEENGKLREQLRLLSSNPEDHAVNAVHAVDARYSYINARVVKSSRNGQRNYIIINKGSEDGVVPNSGIISSRGLVGVVKSVDRRFSYGFTIMNSKVGVSVRIGRSGPVSTLVWDGKGYDGGLVRGRFGKSDDCLGDTVWTSGLSDLFPGEYPVGVVTGSEKESGPYKNLQVSLFQPLDALHYVTVTSNKDAREIIELEEREASVK